MPEIDPRIMRHRLSVCKEARPVAQKKRHFREEKRQATMEEVQKLLQVGFIREIQYTTWLANMVLMKKSNGKWRTCTDYTDLNKACPKDAYPLPNIDWLVNEAAGHKILSFLDAFSGYNQIPMHESDMDKTSFITKTANYCYQVMQFGLKNAGATYQRLINRVFEKQIGKNMEVYVDDMVVKSKTFKQHLEDLTETFAQMRLYNMRLNLTKCVLGVEGGKFLGFMITHRGIEANPDKCETISSMRSPTNLKEVQRLVGRLTSLSKFLLRLTEKKRPIIKVLKKANRFEWDDKCEDAFNEIKAAVSSTPILEKPSVGCRLLLYLSVSENAVSLALVQEEGYQPVYFTGRTLHDAKTRYQLIEKATLTLVYTAKRLRPYFQGQPITVKTDYPVGKVFLRPDLAGRMISWFVELSEFDLSFKPRGPIRAQCLADFVAELHVLVVNLRTDNQDEWKLYVDGYSNQKGCGAGVVLESPSGVRLEQSLHFANN